MAVLLGGTGIAFVVFMFLNWLLGSGGFWSWPNPQPRVGPEPLEIVKVALTVVAGVGGFVALTVAYRRQVWLEADVAGEREQQKALHDRYGAGVAQLGHENPTVRLAGVYALTNLADQWETQRQQCVDVLCAYLRIPWEPPQDPHPIARKTIEAANDPQTGDKTTYTYPSAAGENEVRKTIIRVIADHLRPSADASADSPSWSRLRLDFTSAILPESKFKHCAFGDDVQWRDTHFLNDAEYQGATFTGDAWFSGATFLGDAWFDGAKFKGAARFREATFTGAARFGAATFTRDAEFSWATFTRDAEFGAATFSGGVSQEIHAFLTEEQLAHIGGTGADEAEGGDPAR